MTRAFCVTLTIADNEAFTAFETLNRLGVATADVVRSDVWLFDTAEGELQPPLATTLASIETIFNPNKHRLIERTANRPESGEVWVTARGETGTTTVAGRTIPGVRRIRRCTAWRLLDETGVPVAPGVLARAIETFLCNSAFQEAITA
ncbi:MAG: hypothetical protein JOZ24_11625 [Candidatus Eremiobacteraeota bacterium]|nr:hypothetical protein [Candidatus Eremiobacteraeota bacterium]